VLNYPACDLNNGISLLQTRPIDLWIYIDQLYAVVLLHVLRALFPATTFEPHSMSAFPLEVFRIQDLPVELGRDILEIAARAHHQNALNLALVSKQIYEW